MIFREITDFENVRIQWIIIALYSTLGGKMALKNNLQDCFSINISAQLKRCTRIKSYINKKPGEKCQIYCTR